MSHSDQQCEEPRRWPTRREWGWIVAAAALAVALRVLTADASGFRQDEYYSLRAIQLPVAELVPERLAAGHSPLPFLYEKIFATVLGTGETALRSSSALAGGVAIIALALLAIELGQRAALAPLLLLLVISPYGEWIGTALRYMMPLVAIATLWSWALARHLRCPTPRAALAVALLGGLTLWLHPSAQFVWAALLIFAVAAAWRVGRVAWAALPMLGAQVLALPLLLLVAAMRTGGSGSDPEFSNPRDPFKALLQTLFGEGKLMEDLTGLSDDLFIAVSLLLTVVAIVLVVRKIRRERECMLGAFLLTTMLVIPLSIVLYSGLVDEVADKTRYQAFSTVPMTLLFAVAWREAAALGLARHVFRGLLSLMLLVSVTLHAVNAGDCHREAAQWLGAQRRADEPVLLGGEWNHFAFGYLGVTPMAGVTMVSKYFEEEELAPTMRGLVADGDLGFVLVSARVTAFRQSIRALEQSDFLAASRQWRVGNVRIFGLARTDTGAARLAALPDIEQPRIARQTH